MGDLTETFRERWEDPTPVDHRNPVRGLLARLAREPKRPAPLPEIEDHPPGADNQAVQVLRTYPAKRRPYPFAPSGERSVARGYAKALRRARSLLRRSARRVTARSQCTTERTLWRMRVWNAPNVDDVARAASKMIGDWNFSLAV